MSKRKVKYRSYRVPGVKYITQKEGIQLIDKQARKYLHMSGDDFVKAYFAGEFAGDSLPADIAETDVVRVAMLLPYGGYDTYKVRV